MKYLIAPLVLCLSCSDEKPSGCTPTSSVIVDQQAFEASIPPEHVSICGNSIVVNGADLIASPLSVRTDPVGVRLGISQIGPQKAFNSQSLLDFAVGSDNPNTVYLHFEGRDPIRVDLN